MPRLHPKSHQVKITPEDRFREHWQDLRKLGRQTVESAWGAGCALVEIKAEKSHGDWLPWLKTEGVSHTTAKRLMQLSKIQIAQIGLFENVDTALKSLPKPEKEEKEKEEKQSQAAIKAAKEEAREEEYRIAKERALAVEDELVAIKESAAKILADEPAESLKTKIWNDAQFAQNKASQAKHETALLRQKLADANREKNRLNRQLAKVKAKLLQFPDSEHAQKILTDIFGVALKKKFITDCDLGGFDDFL